MHDIFIRDTRHSCSDLSLPLPSRGSPIARPTRGQSLVSFHIAMTQTTFPHWCPTPSFGRRCAIRIAFVGRTVEATPSGFPHLRLPRGPFPVTLAIFFPRVTYKWNVQHHMLRGGSSVNAQSMCVQSATALYRSSVSYCFLEVFPAPRWLIRRKRREWIQYARGSRMRSRIAS
jgi:hypothetical protein